MKKDELKSKDRGLRLALRHQAEEAGKLKLPEDFTDRLMQRITQPATRPARRRLWLYPAAGVLLVSSLLFIYNKEYTVQPDAPVVIAEVGRDTASVTQDSCLTRMDTSAMREMPVIAQQPKRKPSRKKPQQESARETEISADSLERLTAIIEEELNQVADETYMRQMERMIDSDPQLRMIVDEIINMGGDDEQVAYCTYSI